MRGLIRVAIVEDEPLPRRRIRRILDARADVRVVAEAACRADAVAWLAAHPNEVDALFLDIELGDGTGFDVLDALPDSSALQVVFVTAYDQFAVRAFEVRAVDYLLKPFATKDVERALERVRERIDRAVDPGRSASELATLRELVAELRQQVGGGADFLSRVSVRARGEIRLVPVGAIDWIASADNYVELHCGNALHLVRRPMASFEERLDPARFTRIHRRTIVNVERIRSVRTDASGEFEVLLEDGTALKVGRSYRDRLAHWMNGWPTGERTTG